MTFSSTYERVFALAGVVAMSHFLTPAQIGSFALAVVIVTIATQLTDLGARFALISRTHATEGDIWGHAIVEGGRAAAILVAAGASFPLLALVGGTTLAWLVLAVAALQLVIAAGSTSRVLLEKEFRFGPVAGINVLAATAGLGVGVWLAAAGYGLWALVLGFSSPSIVGSTLQAVGYLAARPLPWRSAAEGRRRLHWFVSYGRPLWLGTQATVLVLQFDLLMVGLLCGRATLGLYDRARKLTDTPVALANATLGRVGLSLYSRLQRLPDATIRAQDSGAALMLRLALPGTALMLVAAPEIVSVLLGSHWMRTALYLRLLSPYLLLRVMDENLLAYFLGVGRTRERKVGWVISGGLALVLVPLLVVSFGATGAAIAVSVAMAAGVAWQQSKVQGTRMEREALLPLVASAVAGAAAFAAASGAGDAADWVRLTIATLTLATVYGVTLAVFEGRRLLRLVREFRSSAAGATVPLPSAPFEIS